ncbi:HAMP domain-containing protein, partial [Oceanospirillum sp. HFRX-1_2]
DLMLTDNRTTTESYITGYSADTAFEVITVIDNGRVLLSNKLAQKGATTKDISCYQRRWVSQAVTEFSPVIQAHPSRQNRLCAVMPITLLEQSNSLRPESMAVLVVEYNMTPAISALQQHIWNPAQWVRHLVFALFVAFLISVLLKRSVIRPLNQIRQRMKEYAQGNVLARVELKGNCELMDVARNFNELVDQISEAELEVRRSEERWIKALDGAGDGVWDLDL